ncbi:UPF0545 protein C22orf39 homolog isoform X1 [Lepus europaeus]|uniref:UPF0545 protein C22orf39 homolog isoform X1 n=1 Tax=Lepus europaeus TaxID=9983 RepID=UPI002B49F92E|nr:UPF0545 protein C22orf39 homolog isoform X1 [Lepus europaeus]
MADGGGGWQPPRPCEAYRAEWKLCRSARHFLHHYYVHGERPSCEQWRRDLARCRAWEERRSAEAQARELDWKWSSRESNQCPYGISALQAMVLPATPQRRPQKISFSAFASVILSNK